MPRSLGSRLQRFCRDSLDSAGAFCQPAGLPEPAPTTQSPSKDQAWVHSWLLFTCQLISTSQKVDLPLCTAASLSRSWDSKEAALKGLKTEARLWLGPYCSCTHASSQLPHSFQNIGKLVRQRCAMHRVWFSPEFTNSFGIYLKKAGRRMNKF